MVNKPEKFQIKNKSSVLQLFVAVSGVFISLFGLIMFNKYVMMSFSLPLRMILMIITQWLLFLIPGILMIINKEKLSQIGFSKEKILLQIGIGILLAISMSLVLTVLPIMLGFKDMIGSTSYTHTWQFIFQFIYSIFGVAFAEELVFRGYIFNKLLKIKNAKWFAIAVSSLLFGLLHIVQGSIIQVLVTAFIGVLFCFFREKIKGCTLLSLIIAHGMYDAMIILWVAIL